MVKPARSPRSRVPARRGVAGGFQPPLLRDVKQDEETPPPRPSRAREDMAQMLRGCGVRMWRIAYDIDPEIVAQAVQNWIDARKAGEDIGAGILYYWLKNDLVIVEDAEPVEAEVEQDSQVAWLERRYNETKTKLRVVGE